MDRWIDEWVAERPESQGRPELRARAELRQAESD